MPWITVASWVSGIGFLGYGVECLRSPLMVAEFERFQVARFRVLTGLLEILGGAGVLSGLLIPWIGVISSLGLSILMAMGVVARRRVGDSWVQCFPAFFFMVLNAVIFLGSLH